MAQLVALGDRQGFILILILKRTKGNWHGSLNCTSARDQWTCHKDHAMCQSDAHVARRHRPAPARMDKALIDGTSKCFKSLSNELHLHLQLWNMSMQNGLVSCAWSALSIKAHSGQWTGAISNLTARVLDTADMLRFNVLGEHVYLNCFLPYAHIQPRISILSTWMSNTDLSRVK